MKIKELVEYLLTLDGDIDVMNYWDEASTCHEMDELPEVKDIIIGNGIASRGSRWSIKEDEYFRTEPPVITQEKKALII